MMERGVGTLRYFCLVLTSALQPHRGHLLGLKHSETRPWAAVLIFNTICLFIMAGEIISPSLLGLSCALLLQ